MKPDVYGHSLQQNLVNSKTIRTRVLFRIISNSNFREVDIKVYNPKMIFIIFLLQSNACLGFVKETSQGDVSFTHPKRAYDRQYFINLS